jgi:1-acyl-sn-glycerol-3-phosphate acyltransferase
MNIASSIKTPAPQRTIPNYTGPAETGSFYNEKAAKKLMKANKALVNVLMRTDIQGAENIPVDGAHMLCFQHEGMTDANLVQSLTDSDYRFMAAKEQFTGPIGKAMTALGAIPVDRGGTGQRDSIKTMTGLLDDGKRVAIAPEGRIYSDGQINEFKEGPAMMALNSKCETMIPVVLDYQPSKPGLLNTAGTYLTTGAVVAGSLAACVFGGTVGQAISGALTGAVTGMVAGGAIGAKMSPHQSMRHKVEDKGLKGAAIGAVLGAAAGGFGAAALGSSALWLTGPTTAITGAVTLGLAKGINERKTARVMVGEGIPVAPYRAMENGKEARKKLTDDLRNTMVELHSQIAPKAVEPTETPEA